MTEYVDLTDVFVTTDPVDGDCQGIHALVHMSAHGTRHGL